MTILKGAILTAFALGTMLDPLGASAAVYVRSQPRTVTRAPAPRARTARPSAPRVAYPSRYQAPALRPRIIVRPRDMAVPVDLPRPAEPDETPAPVYAPAPTESDPSTISTAVTSFRWYYGSQPSPGWRTWWLDGANRWHEHYPDGHEAKIFERVGRRTVGGCVGSVASSEREPDVEVFVPDYGCGSMSVLYRQRGGGWGSLGPMRNVMR